MPEDQSSPPSDRPILAFFDVDNTLMRGTSLFQLGREAWNKKVITWRDLVPFHEYFHGDNGMGIGASHQTGWTGLVAKLLQQSGS